MQREETKGSRVLSRERTGQGRLQHGPGEESVGGGEEPAGQGEESADQGAGSELVCPMHFVLLLFSVSPEQVNDLIFVICSSR